MCGRYFWNDDAEEALEEDFPDLAAEVRRLRESGDQPLRAGDYTPGMNALAVTGGGAGNPLAVTGGGAGNPLAVTGGAAGNPLAVTGGRAGNPLTGARGGGPLAAQVLKWGFQGFDRGKLLINARAESVLERPTFADSFRARRCAMPAAGFYEWDRKKEKVIFTVPERPLLYLAGIFRPYGSELRFVVLTREANASMAPVHDRMPLILDREEVEAWACDAAEAEKILTKELPLLRAERPYEQMTFEW